MISLLNANAIISTSQYEIHTPFPTSDMSTSFKMEFQNGTQLSVKEYLWPNKRIKLINDSMHINDTSFFISGINDTLIAYEDTLCIVAKKQ